MISREIALQIIREVCGGSAPKRKKTGRLTETDIDLFDEDEKEQ